MDEPWVAVPSYSAKSHQESLPDRVRRVKADLNDLTTFYNVSISDTRYTRLHSFLLNEIASLESIKFDQLSQQDKVDFVLLRNFLHRQARQLDLERARKDGYAVLVPFASLVISICEDRQRVEPMRPDLTAQKMHQIKLDINQIKDRVREGKAEVDKASALRAVDVVSELREHLAETYRFYASYDPLFDWWVAQPWREVDAALKTYVPLIRYQLAGMNPDVEDEIVGQPIGRDGLLAELAAEMIAYSPEELITIAREQYAWCEEQIKAASRELGFGDRWKRALDYVKRQSVPPGEQTKLVLDLAREGTSFVRQHDLVTVPVLADETYRMFMMTPEDQKVAPFFLGGPSILVSYPTADMPYELKQMVMRGNNRHFSRAVAFHELIPGHRLQMFMAERHNSHRQLFSTPFFVEGWAMYWEMVFWSRGDFFVSAEDRIGSLFWRMHRCARIIFSLNFHLGKMTAPECVDLLVDWVGHERSTAEGEVKRSFNGDWSPLYQCGYMLGALQLFLLRREALEKGLLSEKQFNDAVLKSNMMPIELLRALLLDQELSPDYEAKWRFYDE
ncbi:hypothetical protein NLU13_8751 [Sarocladium strictum]|uniref:X-Pro dipeptidyl-peptidase n=1 Tax=Sarocladium strictum TaxID=5046 RepID=A0AA39L5G1_SARSR|nr:hypothetical protein NLU13_8751 [Sarocladium strictum]